jgi:hypothetical protein
MLDILNKIRLSSSKLGVPMCKLQWQVEKVELEKPLLP